MEHAINLKLIVLGAQGVGKSSLITRYIKGEFQENYNVTVGVQFFSKLIQVESGNTVRLQVWDTAGQEFFRSLVRSFYKGIVAVFLIFALDNLATFNELSTWVEQLKESAHEEVVLFLVGARADIESKREVEGEQAATFLKRINGALYVQTSAKTGQNIPLLFERVANILQKKYQSNTAFRRLVQPDNEHASGQKGARTSIVLNRHSLPTVERKDKKKSCCH